MYLRVLCTLLHVYLCELNGSNIFDNVDASFRYISVMNVKMNPITYNHLGCVLRVIRVS
jgi:hypothetical protein